MLQTTKDFKIINDFSEVLESLSEKEELVIKKRIWLDWEKMTLQSIGQTFIPNITRERVRQIESAGIKKIWRIIKATDLVKLQKFTKKNLEDNGWLLSRDDIISDIIKEFDLDNKTNIWILETIIESDYYIQKSKPKLGTKTYFFLPNISRVTISSIHKEASKILKKQKDIIKNQALIGQVKKALGNEDISDKLILNTLNIYEDIILSDGLVWLTKWKILNPKTLKDKAIYILRWENKPMHFIDISNKIAKDLWWNVKVSTVHNELIRNDDFVLVWKGIYALTSWWIYKPWTVLDVITEVLEKNGWAMSTEDITKKVLKLRKVKPSTIYMNLQNKTKISRVWRNFYILKD